MSKSRGPHEAVKPLLPVLSSDPGKGSALLHTVVQILTALSLFFVVMAPIAYVNGRAYHDGWYDALHLDQAMFPLDAQGTTTQAMVAWEVAFSAMFSGTSKAFAAHWLPVFVGLAADFVLIVGFAWLIERWDDQRKKQMGVAAKKEKSPLRRALDRALQPILVLGLSVATIFMGIACLMVVIAGLILPFSKVGGDEARREIASNFAEAPLMNVKSPNGDLKVREIACGLQFCAFWETGDVAKGDRAHATLAPVSAVSWGEAPPPGSK